MFCHSQDSAFLGSFSISSSLAENSSSDSASIVIVVGSSDDCEEKDREAETQLKVAPAKTNVKETRRELLKHLQEKRSAKLSKRLSTDVQLLYIAKQELQL